MSEYKQIETIEELVRKRDGEKIRFLVKNIAQTYLNMQDTSELETTVKDSQVHPLIRGLASSAHYCIVGNIDILHECQFGGLGLTTKNRTDTYRKRFDGKKLWFAEGLGESFETATFSEYAGWFSKFSEDSGKRAHGNDFALWHSELKGRSMTKATIVGNSLAMSIIGENAISEATIEDDAGFNSTISGNAGKDSRNRNNAFQFSNVSGFAFKGSVNRGYAFKGARIFENAFLNSTNLNQAFHGIEIETTSAFIDSIGSIARVHTKSEIADAEEKTLEIIGKKLGLTRETIRKIQSDGIKNLGRGLVELMAKEIEYRHLMPGQVFRELSAEFYRHLQIEGDGDRLNLGNLAQHFNSEKLVWQTKYPAYSTNLRLQTYQLGDSSEQSNLVSWFRESFTSKVLWATRNGVLEYKEE